MTALPRRAPPPRQLAPPACGCLLPSASRAIAGEPLPLQPPAEPPARRAPSRRPRPRRRADHERRRALARARHDGERRRLRPLTRCRRHRRAVEAELAAIDLAVQPVPRRFRALPSQRPCRRGGPRRAAIARGDHGRAARRRADRRGRRSHRRRGARSSPATTGTSRPWRRATAALSPRGCRAGRRCRSIPRAAGADPAGRAPGPRRHREGAGRGSRGGGGLRGGRGRGVLVNLGGDIAVAGAAAGRRAGRSGSRTDHDGPPPRAGAGPDPPLGRPRDVEHHRPPLGHGRAPHHRSPDQPADALARGAR